MKNNNFIVEMLDHLRVSIIATILLAVICCGIYPAIVWGLAQTLFHHQANGSLITKDGKPTDDDSQAVGSSLLGQPFGDAKYFHPRPSAAGNGYDPTSSGGTNLGPTSQKLIDSVRDRAAKYRAENHLSPDALIPPDAVTSSASGLDPHISVANAELQAPRIAEARQVPVERVRSLIARYTEGPDLGILGDPGINVLKLNIALDSAKQTP